MYKLILFLLIFIASPASAQPTPQADESFDSFKARYVAWYETIAAEDRAWEEMETIDRQLDEQLAGLKLTADPSDDDWNASVAFVRGQGELLDRIRGYSPRAYLGLPPEVLFDDESDGKLPRGIGLLLPNLGVIRAQTRLLMIDAILAGQDGDHDRVLADIRAVRGLQRFIPVANTALELLVDIAISSVVAESILSDQIDLSDWSAQELEQLSILFEIPNIQGIMSQAIASEQWINRDMLEWFYVDAQHGKMTFLGAKRFLAVMRMLDSSDGDDEMSKEEKLKMLANARALRTQVRPLQEQRALADQLFKLAIANFSEPSYELKSFQYVALINEQLAQEDKPFEYAPVVLVIPDLSRVYRRVVQAQAVESAATLLIALHRYHRKHGEFPASIDELDRDLLAADVPIDPHSGQPIRYMLVDGHPVIYSFGPDRDDDGGRRAVDAKNKPGLWPRFLTIDELEALDEAERAAIDGDWVLYPAVR